MRQHRRLAIARAPLSWRLKVLRAIADRDSMNLVWSEDIEAWEKVRLAEIPRELENARSAADYSTCRYLAEELQDSNWIITPPQQLVASASAAVDSLEYNDQCQELRQTGESLYDAFCAQDEASGRKYRAGWLGLTGSMKRPPPIELSELVEPALLWLSELDLQEQQLQGHLQAVEDLRQLLDRPGSILEIERAYQLATAGGIGLDPVVERRVKTVLGELRLAGKRKAQMRIAAMAAASLLLLVWFSVRQWRSIRAAELQSSIASIEKMLEEDRVSEASQFLEQLKNSKPHLWSTVQVQSLQSSVEGLVAQDQQREAQFQELLAKLEAVEPLAIDIGLLEKAEKLAKTEPEKTAVFSVRRRKMSADTKREADHLSAIVAETAKISSELDQIESLEPAMVNLARIDRLVDQLGNLATTYPRGGSAGRDMIDNVKRRAQGLSRSVRDLVAAERRRNDAIKLISQAKTTNAFQAALENFVSTVEDPVQKRAFSDVLNNRASWQVFDQWNFVTEKTRDFNQRPSSAGAEKLLNLLRDFESKAVFGFELEEYSQAKANLVSFTQRRPALESLVERLQKSLLSTLYTLEVSEQQFVAPRRYFAHARSVERDPKKYTDRANLAPIDIVSELNGAVKKITVKPPVKIVKQPKQFIESTIDDLSLRSNELLFNWEREILRLIGRVLDERELDGRAKEELISLILETSFSASPYLEQRLRPTLVQLKRGLSREPWINPTQPSYEIEQSLLKEMKAALSTAFTNLSQPEKTMRWLGASSVQLVGFLDIDSRGQVVPKSSVGQQSKGYLLTVSSKPSESNKTTIIAVARFDGGRVTALPAVSEATLGSPLFFLTEDASL
jgi:hypothetical protein